MINPRESSVDSRENIYLVITSAVFLEMMKLVKREALLSNPASGKGIGTNFPVLCPS